jgi:TonB family protein
LEFESCAGWAAVAAEAQPDPDGRLRTDYFNVAAIFMGEGVRIGLKPDELDHRLDAARLNAQAHAAVGQPAAEAAECARVIRVFAPLRSKADKLVVTHPDWLTRPNAEDVGSVYPPAAREAGTEGSALIYCRVMADQTVSDCMVTKEDPPEKGFGAAAIKVSAVIRMRPGTIDGVAVTGAPVAVPISFKLSGYDTAATDAPEAPAFGSPEAMTRAESCVGLAQLDLKHDAESAARYAYWMNEFTSEAVFAGEKPEALFYHLAHTRTDAAAMSAPAAKAARVVCDAGFRASIKDWS